jgi:hypothetical protein
MPAAAVDVRSRPKIRMISGATAISGTERSSMAIGISLLDAAGEPEGDRAQERHDQSGQEADEGVAEAHPELAEQRVRCSPAPSSVTR